MENKILVHKAEKCYYCHESLIDSASGQDHQIALLWKAIESLSTSRATTDCPPDCMPQDAARKECFEAEKLNQLIGK